jgi:hypothetical protein
MYADFYGLVNTAELRPLMEQQGTSIIWFINKRKQRSSDIKASHPMFIPLLVFHFDKILLAFLIVPDSH